MLQMHKWQLLPPKRVKGMYDSFTNLPQIKSFSSLNLYENRTLGPPPPLPPRSTRPDYVSVERSVDSDTKAPLVVVEVSDSESDGLKDLEKSLTVVEISDTESDDLVEPSKNVSANVQAIDSDAKSAAVTNAGAPSLRSMPPPRGATESHAIANKSSLLSSINPHRLSPCGSPSSSGQTPRRGKQVFYVVTKGRRTGVFESWSVDFTSLFK